MKIFVESELSIPNEIYVNHHHYYHSQVLLISALVYCDDYKKQSKIQKKKERFIRFIYFNRLLIYLNMIFQTDVFYQSLLKKKYFEIVFINYYHSIRMIKHLFDYIIVNII